MSLPSAVAPVRVLIVDDSSFMRTQLSRMVESDATLSVAGTACDGLDALDKIQALRPDVVTLDIDMPRLNGMATLERVMAESQRPVIMVSALTRPGAEMTQKAMALGAFDCIAKELGFSPENAQGFREELVGKIKAAAASGKHSRSTRRADAASALGGAAGRNATMTATAVSPEIIAICASTGGPKALEELLGALPADLPAAILVVQHMSAGLTDAFTKRLDDLCPMRVEEALDGALVAAGHVYVATSRKHLTVRRPSLAEVRLRLSSLPANCLHIPSADVMMNSVAEVYQSAAMGVVLTGMGADGALGMRDIHRAGGFTVGQDQASCVIYGMPRICAKMGVLSEVAPLSEIPQHILRALRYRKAQPAQR